jgi:hypothetical protein
MLNDFIFSHISLFDVDNSLTTKMASFRYIRSAENDKNGRKKFI